MRKDQLSRANGRLYAAELTMNTFVGPPLGGFLVAVTYLDVGPASFMDRLIGSLYLKDLMVGLIKSVAFAQLIAGAGGDDAPRVERAVLDAGADIVHFDVMDNHFVPNLTIGPLICDALRNFGIEEPIDVHLMVEPVDRIRDAGHIVVDVRHVPDVGLDQRNRGGRRIVQIGEVPVRVAAGVSCGCGYRQRSDCLDPGRRNHDR